MWLMWFEILLFGLLFLFLLWLLGSIKQLEEQVEQLQNFYEEILEKMEII